MANSLQRFLHPARRAYGSTVVSLSRSFSSDSLVEIKPGEIGMVSGIPQEHLRRRVVIFSPARTATQQGSGKVGRWKINFMSTLKWENPLMGWTSTGDPYANVGDAGLGFDSEEAAVAFAQKHGWDYMVKKQHTPLLKVKAYADNCKWKALPKLRKFDFSPKSSFSWLILAKAFVTLWRLAFPLWLSTKQVVLEKYELPRLQ